MAIVLDRLKAKRLVHNQVNHWVPWRVRLLDLQSATSFWKLHGFHQSNGAQRIAGDTVSINKESHYNYFLIISTTRADQYTYLLNGVDRDSTCNHYNITINTTHACLRRRLIGYIPILCILCETESSAFFCTSRSDNQLTVFQCVDATELPTMRLCVTYLDFLLNQNPRVIVSQIQVGDRPYLDCC